jgi:hypothetical protein
MFDTGQFLQALIPAAVDFGGTLIQNHTAGAAANTQTQSGKDALALLERIYTQQYGNLAPYSAAGLGALSQLQRGMGIRAPRGMTAGGPGSSMFTSSLLGNPGSGGRGGSTLGRIGRAAGAGASLGSFVPGVGTLAGAGAGAIVGGVSSLFGRGRREANQFTPMQTATDQEISRIINAVNQGRQSGTLTSEDLQTAINTVQGLQQQFFDVASQHGDPGKRGIAAYHQTYDPYISGWQNELGSLSSGDTTNMVQQPDGSYAPAGEDQVGNAIGFGEFNQPFTLTDLYKDPSYEFRLQEGLKGAEQQAAARGVLNTGGTVKALERYRQDYASNEFAKAHDRFKQDQNDRFSRLFSLTGLGYGAANQQNAAGSDYGKNATNLITGIGDVNAAAQTAKGSNWAGLLNTGGATLQDILKMRQSGYGSSGGGYQSPAWRWDLMPENDNG